MKILILSAVRLVANLLLTLKIFHAHKKRINLVLQVSNLVLARGQCGNNFIVNVSAKRPFFIMKTLSILIGFSAFPTRVAPISNDQELYNLDPKLTLTCIALLRKVPILYRIVKKYSASSAIAEKNT